MPNVVNNPIILNVVIPIMLIGIYAECRYPHYAECCYAECQYAECHYTERRYAECRYAECHGTGLKWV